MIECAVCTTAAVEIRRGERKGKTAFARWVWLRAVDRIISDGGVSRSDTAYRLCFGCPVSQPYRVAIELIASGNAVPINEYADRR